MPSESVTNAPSFSPDRTVDELLVPVTPEAAHERAVAFAATLAGAWDLPIRIVHVTGSISSDDRDLDKIAGDLAAHHPELSVTAEHLYGDDPAIAIAQELRPQTLPIVASEDADRWRFKESTAESLIGHGGVPMLLLGPNVSKQDAQYHALDGEVVVGLDGSKAAESAIAPALGLARAIGQPVWFVTVVPEPDTVAVDAVDGDGDGDGDGEHLTRPGLYLDELAKSHDSGIGIRWEVIQGNDPVATLEAFANRRSTRFIVACTGGRFTARHSMASITSGLVSVSARPVLALKASTD